jgi:predicted dinucleotide-binding enzyme
VRDDKPCFILRQPPAVHGRSGSQLGLGRRPGSRIRPGAQPVLDEDRHHPYTAVEQIGQEFGAALAAKPLILDVSNPIPARDGQDFVNRVVSEGGPGLVTAKLLKGARIVRAFNAINYKLLDISARRPGEPVGVPIAGDDAKAIDLASRLIRETGFEPVLVGNLAKGKYLVPGTPVAGEHTPAELRRIAATLG